MSLNIKFISPFKGFIEHPKPSINHIPFEFKKLQNYWGSSVKEKTVKKCIPFLDSLTCGYIIPFPIDYQFYYDRDEQKAIFKINKNIPYEFVDDFNVAGHNEGQIPKELRHVHRTVEAIFKFKNPWVIKTPPGYSCIFTQPFNRNLPFKIIDGIVDTDKYDLPINFPFYWTNKIDNPFLLKSGTPMVLVIPFKRDSWRMRIESIKTEKLYESLPLLKYFSKIYDNYRNNSWSKKQYK